MIDAMQDTTSIDDDLVFEEFEEDGMKYTLFTGYSGIFYEGGIYVKEKTVFLIYGFGTDRNETVKHVGDVCSAMKVASPDTL